MRENQGHGSRTPAEESVVPKSKSGGLTERRALSGARMGGSQPSARAPLPPVWEPPVRIDLSHLTAAPPLHRPTVNGGGASHPAPHVGGGVQPPAESAIGLSDGTRISFAEVEEIPVREYA